MSSSRDRHISGYPDLGDFYIFKAEVINNKDDHQKCRFQCRMIGHETDETTMPDEELQWYSPMTPETSHRGMGYNPRYVPGDQVYCLQFGDERIILGSARKENPYEGEEADVNPGTLDGTASQKSPPPGQNDRNNGWDRWPSEKTTTRQAREGRRKREDSAVKKGQEKTPNPFKRTASRFLGGEFLSIGKDLTWDNQENPMKFIKSSIQNKGAVVPEMLEMVETLRTKPGKSNPHPIQAVGAQNYMNFIKNLKSYFDKFQKQEQKKQREKDEELKEKEKEDEESLLVAQAIINENEASNG